MIKIMICDDINHICNQLSNLISAEPDMEVVCTATSGAESLELALKYKPDIILMDIQMESATSGIDATEKILDELPETKIIILTIHMNDDLIYDSYLSGAIGYILKTDDNNKIISTIRSAYENDFFIEPFLAKKIKEKVHDSRKLEVSIMFFINNMTQLTQTERSILRLLYDGKKRRQIAEMQYVSEATVKQHINHILKKLNFTSTKQLLDFLRSIGIMEKLNF